MLYVLLIYGFNRMLRFNNKGDYNLPVGNIDFNTNTYQALVNYFLITQRKKITFTNLDYNVFFQQIDLTEKDFIYLDPPYLITFSEYNKLWNEQQEKNLLNTLDNIHRNGIKFAISNVVDYKGRKNNIFVEWSHKYNMHNIKSNYISYHDNSTKKFSEVLITNY